MELIFKRKQNRTQPQDELFFNSFVEPGFDLRASCLLGRYSYHLSYTASPELNCGESGIAKKRTANPVSRRHIETTLILWP
jgi:hypothetical protein